MSKLILFFLICSPLYVFGFINRAEIVKNMNSARTNPSQFASVIETKYMTFQRLKWLIGSQTFLTTEGYSAVQEATTMLRSMSPLSSLTNSQGLDVSAQVQANYLINQTVLPNNPYLGCSNTNVGVRISEIGTWQTVGESIIGRVFSAEAAVVQLIISDGDIERRHQSNLFNPDYTHVGFGFSSHTDVPNLLVINYAGHFSCKSSVCPKIPTANVPFDCDGPGFEYGGAALLKLPLIVTSLFCLLYLI